MELSDQDYDSNANLSHHEDANSLPPCRYKSSIRYTFISGPTPTRPQFLLSVTQSLKLRWDVFIMLLAVWNCFYVPFVVAFMSVEANVALVVTSALVDLAYFVDIAVCMRTTYVDLGTGEEVTDSLKIIKNYFKSGKLAVDVISAIPFDVIYLFSSQHEGLQLIALTKVVRLLRLSKIFIFLRAKSHVKLRIKLSQLLFVFAIYLHVTACLWFMLIDYSDAYVPPALYVDRHPDLYHDGEVLRQYAYSLYMAVYMLTGAEIGPRVGAERIFAGCLILLGQLFQAYMFGEIAVVLFDLNKKSSLISEVQDAATTAMTNIGLDSGLQAKIGAFLRYSQGRARHQAEFEEFFRLLPPSMKQEVRAITFDRLLVLNPALVGHDQIQTHLLHRLQTLYSQPEEKIITQGEEAESLFFVASGKCHVFVLDADKKIRQMKSLGLGQHFGEIAMVFPTLRTASVVSAGHATLAVLSKADFTYLSYRYPKLVPLLKATAVRYHDNWKKFLKSTVRKCPFFAHLSGSLISEIIYRLPTSRLQSSTHIYKEGDIASKILFILDGSVEVYIPLNDERLMMQSLETATKEGSSLSPLSPRLRRSSLVNSIKKCTKMTFMVNVVMEELGTGSVLSPNLALLPEGTVNFHAQTTETTIVMTLSKDLLTRLCKEFPEISQSVKRHIDYLTDVNQLTRVQRLQLTGLDYICNFPASPQEELFHLWKAKMKVRRCVIGKLLEKRHIRSTGFQGIASLSHKLKGLILAEAQGDLVMAEKIRRGFLPVSADLIFPALQLLHLVEVENPILTQFAMEAVKVSEVVFDSRDALVGVYVQVRKLEKDRENAKKMLREMQKLARLVQALSGERRGKGKG